MSKRGIAKQIAAESGVLYHYQGNFTVAIVTWHGLEGIGVSKRNPIEDEYNKQQGERRAYGRAVRDLVAKAVKVQYATVDLYLGDAIDFQETRPDGVCRIIRVCAVEHAHGAEQ